MWQHAWKKRLPPWMAVDSMQKRYFGFAKIRCQKCTWTYTFDDTFASLKGHSRSLFFHAFLIYSGLSLFFFTAESLSLWEKCGSIKTVHPCTVLMPSFVNKTRYCFVYPALHGGCFYSIQKSSPALWENLLFRCYLSRFFSQLMPWYRLLWRSKMVIMNV